MRTLLVIAALVTTAVPQRPVFRARTNLVAMNVTVMDENGAVVRGLTQDVFTVTEDGEAQPIAQFAAASVPLSLVIAVDASLSMRGGRFEFARQAVLHFFDGLGADDEFVVFGFNDRPFNINKGSKEREVIAREMSRVQPNGATSLYDAVAAGVEALESAGHRRRALVVISDGDDQLPSRYQDPRAASAARESIAAERVRRSEALVYAIGVNPPHKGGGYPLNVAALDRLTAPTGGETRMVTTDAGIVTAAEQIGDQLRQQYVIGFAPAHADDGTFHQVRVTVSGCEKCRVRARAGFIADEAK